MFIYFILNKEIEIVIFFSKPTSILFFSKSIELGKILSIPIFILKVFELFRTVKWNLKMTSEQLSGTTRSYIK